MTSENWIQRREVEVIVDMSAEGGIGQMENLQMYLVDSLLDIFSRTCYPLSLYPLSGGKIPDALKTSYNDDYSILSISCP